MSTAVAVRVRPMIKNPKPRWFENARRRMSNLGISYADLAARLSERGLEECGKSTVGAWMVGRNEPPLAALSAIAELLGVSMSELIGEDIYFVRDPVTRLVVERLDSMSDEEKRAVLKLLGINEHKKPATNYPQ